MTIYEMVVSDYAEFIQMDSSVPYELKNSLRVKERTPLFINKIVDQIHQIEVLKPNIKLDRMKIKMLVYELTKMYVHLLKTQADELRMSDLAKDQARQAIEGDALIKKFDKDGNADFTEELGIKIQDRRT